MSFLEMIAAAVKDNQGRPCNAAAGPGGSEHYIKNLYNGRYCRSFVHVGERVQSGINYTLRST